MSEEELKQVNEILIPLWEKTKEMVDLLKPLNKRQLEYLQHTYKFVEEKDIIERLKKGNNEK